MLKLLGNSFYSKLIEVDSLTENSPIHIYENQNSCLDLHDIVNMESRIKFE